MAYIRQVGDRHKVEIRVRVGGVVLAENFTRDTREEAEREAAARERALRKSGRARGLECPAFNSASMLSMALSTTEPLPAPGVYFLLDSSGAVTYVGQSWNVLSRMSGHDDKEFSRVRMLRIDDAKERLQVERQFISLLSPKHNVKMVQ